MWVLLDFLLTQELRHVQFVHCHVAIDDTLLFPVTQADIDLVGVLGKNLVLEAGLLNRSLSELGSEPTFEAPQIRVVISNEFPFNWLVTLPEFFNGRPLTLTFVGWLAKVLRRLVVLVFSIEPMIVVRLLVVVELVAV